MTSADAPHPLHWDAKALWHALVADLPGLSVEVVARTDSTNSQLLERARSAGGRRDQPVTQPGDLPAGLAHEPASPQGRRAVDIQPCLLVAEHQMQGRGRAGRPWQASPGASLTFSLSLALAPAHWGGLSLAVGVALADALDVAPARIGLKWPNDLWLTDADGGGRKLGGILVETLAVGAHRMVVVGVGLNIAAQSLPGLSSGYAWLQEIAPELDAPLTLHRVAAPLVRALLRFEVHGFDAELRERYAQRDLLQGREVTTTAPGIACGTACGVSERGALRVRTDDDVLHEVASGEVSVGI